MKQAGSILSWENFSNNLISAVFVTLPMRFFLLISFLASSVFGYSQTDTTQPPYKRFPTLPPFHILLSDSTTIYTKAELPKKKAVMFMIFGPDCSHCQHETEQMIAHKEELKDVQIVMVTMHPMVAMRNFISRYKLAALSNIIVGKDIGYFMSSFYKFHNLPYHAFYNKKGALINAFEGSMEVEKVIEVLKGK
jgi:thioredoxin-related protein